MKLGEIKYQGKRTDLTSAQVEPTLRSNEELAQTSPDSRPQIQRHIHHANLVPELLKLVDEQKMAFIFGGVKVISKGLNSQQIREELLKIRSVSGDIWNSMKESLNTAIKSQNLNKTEQVR